MPKFTKDVISPGVYRKAGREIPVTGEDIREMLDGFKAAKAAGIRIPLPWEHPAVSDPDGLPVLGSDTERVRAREASRLNAGWLDDLFLENGELKAVIDVKATEDAKRLEEVGGFVSPQFGPFTLPDGTQRKNFITHLAITPQPVNTRQTDKFTRVTALSQLSGETFQLSLADLAGKMSGKGDCDGDGDGGATGNSDGTDLNGSGGMGQQKPNQATSTNQVSQDTATRLKSALAAMGITIADASSLAGSEEALGHLLQAVTAWEQQQAAAASAANNPNLNGQNNQNQPVNKPGNTAGDNSQNSSIREEPTIVAMSQATTQTAVPPAAKAPATPAPAVLPPEVQTQLSQLQAQNTILIERQTAADRQRYLDRIDAAFKSGRVAKPMADALKALAGTHQFSIGSPNAKTELDFKLETVESFPEGSVWTPDERVRQMSVREVPHDNAFFSGNDISDAEADELIDKDLGFAKPTNGYTEKQLVG